MPRPEAMLMMTPRLRAIMCWPNARAMRKGVVMLILSVRSQTSGAIEHAGARKDAGVVDDARGRAEGFERGRDGRIDLLRERVVGLEETRGTALRHDLADGFFAQGDIHVPDRNFGTVAGKAAAEGAAEAAATASDNNQFTFADSVALDSIPIHRIHSRPG